MKTAREYLKEAGLLSGKDNQFDLTLIATLEDYADEYHESKVNNLRKPDVIGSVCPICNAPLKSNSYDSGLPIQVCSNLDCDWTY